MGGHRFSCPEKGMCPWPKTVGNQLMHRFFEFGNYESGLAALVCFRCTDQTLFLTQLLNAVICSYMRASLLSVTAASHIF